MNQSFVYTHLNLKTVLFQRILFSISILFSSIQLIDRTLSGATTPGQSGPGSDGNELQFQTILFSMSFLVLVCFFFFVFVVVVFFLLTHC